MALELNWVACKDTKYAEAIGFYMMFTDIGWELTEKNAEDFYVRCSLHYKLVGPIWHSSDGPLRVTPEIVRDCIGLKANVAPRTFTQFAMRMVGNTRQELQFAYRKNA